MKHHDDWNVPPERACNPEVVQRLWDWCRWQACQAHGDEALAGVLHEGMAYALTRRDEQLRKMAVILMPDDTYKALRVSWPKNVDFNSHFSKCLALYATALDIPAAAIVCEVWIATKPLAPGQRPSQQVDRQEAVLICAQGRMASPINVMIPIIDGCSVPLPQLLPEGYATSIGLGRFITSCSPSAAERESAKAVLKRLGIGEDTVKFEIPPERLADVAAYNPDAKSQEW